MEKIREKIAIIHLCLTEALHNLPGDGRVNGGLIAPSIGVFDVVEATARVNFGVNSLVVDNSTTQPLDCYVLSFRLVVIDCHVLPNCSILEPYFNEIQDGASHLKVSSPIFKVNPHMALGRTISKVEDCGFVIWCYNTNFGLIPLVGFLAHVEFFQMYKVHRP